MGFIAPSDRQNCSARRVRAGKWCGDVTLVALVVLGSAVFELTLSAQQVITLVSFTNEWAYNQSGLEPDPAWATDSYSDQAWPRGRGLLGFDDNGPYFVHAPTLTEMVISPAVTSYYFRTTFQFTGSTAGLLVVASNLVDDGCVVYLNGTELVRQRVPRNQNAATLAIGSPVTEGTLEPTIITNLDLLRQGENLLAVEVHQAMTLSTDIMWGMKLVSIRDLPLQVAEQPQDLEREVGQPAQFSFRVSGSPTFYRWYCNGSVIPAATSSTLLLPAVTLNDTGLYFALVTNRNYSITSRWAWLTVYEDRAGPRLLSAIATAPQGTTNLVDLTYSEQLHAPSATNLANYVLTRLATGAAVSITNVLALPASGLPAVRLFVDASDPDWVLDAPCYLTVNHVADRLLNVIAPDSRIALTWPQTGLLLATDDVWSYHAAAAFDPGVFGEPWTQPGYETGPWWAQSRGVFAAGVLTQPPCLGQLSTPLGFQPEPVLFRTSFQWPAELGTEARLRLYAQVDAGAVVYLNGTELWRTNLPTGAIGLSTRALLFGERRCHTNVVIQVNNLRNGTNWLAAAVAPGGAASMFGLQVWATTIIPGPLPDNPSPVLRIEPVDAQAVRLLWNGAGYTLEAKTNLIPNTASSPMGRWEQVPNLTNPYLHFRTNTPEGGARFFRLKR